MYWYKEVEEKLKRKNQILFSKDSEFLQDIALLIQNQNHRTVVLWALDLAEESVRILEERYPGENRPRKAIEATRLWAAGKIKMPQAKREILNCHALAKEISDLGDIALCHAVGQACGVVHTVGHAMGYPIYELTAVVRKYGIDNCKDVIELRKQEYIDRLNYWKNNYRNHKGEWADFMLK